MKQMKVIILFLLLLSMLAYTCNNSYSSWIRTPKSQATITTVDFKDWADILVNKLVKNLMPKKLSEYPCIITTIVNINNLEQSCPFSRELTEAIRTALFKKKANIIEVMAAKYLLVSPGKGTFLLSRNAKLITSTVKARAILVGTYLVGTNTVTINLRLIGAKSHKIISVASLTIDKTPALKELLKNEPLSNISGYETLPFN